MQVGLKTISTTAIYQVFTMSRLLRKSLHQTNEQKEANFILILGPAIEERTQTKSGNTTLLQQK